MTAPKQSETSDDSELVERLRWIHDHNLASFAGNAACSAADRIEALSAALADANTRIGELQEQAKHYPTVAGENMRLREEITALRRKAGPLIDITPTARAALTPATEKEPGR